MVDNMKKKIINTIQDTMLTDDICTSNCSNLAFDLHIIEHRLADHKSPTHKKIKSLFKSTLKALQK